MSSFFTDTILERGKKYFEQNRVFSVNQKDDKTYTAIVLGSEAYHTKITLVNMKQHSILRLKKDFLRMKNNI